MDMEPVNPTPLNTPIDTSTNKVFGIPRRVLAFGFFLFVLLVVLTLVYSQFASQKAIAPVMTDSMVTEKVVPTDMMMPGDKAVPVVGPVTPETVTNDLIDEAVADRDDVDTYTDDEMADVQDGSNY